MEEELDISVRNISEFVVLVRFLEGTFARLEHTLFSSMLVTDLFRLAVRDEKSLRELDRFSTRRELLRGA